MVPARSFPNQFGHPAAQKVEYVKLFDAWVKVWIRAGFARASSSGSTIIWSEEL